jgi:LuxR family transcriptional regulator, maltose regulon positive regulatory protein
MITDNSPLDPVLMSNALELRQMRKSDGPPPLTEEVDRARIRSKVGRRLGLPVILISAPAGYGKSVLAAQLVRHNPLPFVWLSLTESDNDPVHLVRSLVVRLNHIESAGRKPVKAFRIPTQHDRESSLPELLRCMQEAAPLVIVIDDLHAVTAQQSVAVVRHLVENLPTGCQIVLTSRTDPDFGVARLRLSGELLEIRADLLALDIEETAQLLDRAGLDLDEKAVGLLHSRTEGWPAGIGMIVRSLDEEDGDHNLEQGFSGRWRYVADYFFEEVLSRQTKELRRFLIETSVADRFCGQLCDILLDRQGSDAVLRELERMNLFVVALDDNREWYRYHRLFQEMLQAELDRTEPSARRVLHARAAAWHEEHGSLDEALDYARMSGDLDRAARIVCGHVEDYARLGTLEDLRVRLEEWTEEEIESDPRFALGAGWVYLHLGGSPLAGRYATAAGRGNLDQSCPSGASSLRSALAILRGTAATGGVNQMLTDGLFASAMERSAGTRRTDAGCRIVGVAQALLGRPDEAITSLEDALLLTGPQDQLERVFCLGYLGLAYLDRGEEARARPPTRQALRIIVQLGLEKNWMSLPAFTANLTVLARSGQRAGARSELAAVRDRLHLVAAVPWLIADVASRCAEASLAIGDPQTASALAETAHYDLARLPDAGIIPARLARLSSDAAHSSPLLATLTPAEKRVLNELATYRTLAEIAGKLSVSRTTVKTHVASLYSKLNVSTRAQAVAALGIH